MTGRTKNDLTGQRFGKLTALHPGPGRYGRPYSWICRCDCGNETNVYTSHLTSGRVSSCGCGYVSRKALMSAAPDLLAALEKMLTIYAPSAHITAAREGEEALHCVVREARAAIAKAKGA